MSDRVHAIDCDLDEDCSCVTAPPLTDETAVRLAQAIERLVALIEAREEPGRPDFPCVVVPKGKRIA